MVRAAYVDSNGLKKGAWSQEEDIRLRAYLTVNRSHLNWRFVPTGAGLARCGKSCRLRWVNYLQPGLKRGNFTNLERDLILKLHSKLGNKWSAIAAELPGRTDNEVKNYWNGHILKRRQYKRKPSAVKYQPSDDQNNHGKMNHQDQDSLPYTDDELNQFGNCDEVLLAMENNESTSSSEAFQSSGEEDMFFDDEISVMLNSFREDHSGVTYP